MTFKQKLKLVNIICLIAAAISLVLPVIKTSTDNYNALQLISRNGFKIGILFLIILIALALASSFLGANYDRNKYIPLLTLVFAIGALILSILIKQISKSEGEIMWMDLAKIYIGGWIIIVTLSISVLTNLVIAFRSIVLKKNDEVEEIEEEIVEEEIVDTSSTVENNTQPENVSTIDDVKAIEDVDDYYKLTDYKQ